jgi:hypothetical protein
MKTLRSCLLVVAALIAANWNTATHAQVYASYYPPRAGGYVYYPPTGWAVPPPIVPYYGGPYVYGANYRALPPYGFGSPYYYGYNDPYFYSYGRGVRDFLRMGGADFYGW